MAKVFLLLAAGISFFLSVYLWFTGDKQSGLFVAIWVPTMLSFGTYIKRK